MRSQICLLSLLLLFLLSPLPTSARRAYDSGHDWYEKRRLKAHCLRREDTEGRGKVSRCWFWEGTKSWWSRTSISWFPEKTKNWTLAQVKAHCDNYFTCMDNTGCYKDVILYETLDRCSHDAFSIGPMSFCDAKLEDLVTTSSETVPECVKDYLKQPKKLKKTECENVRKTEKCLGPAVEKHCDPNFLAIFREHYQLRLYNLGCDGKLKFEDVEEEEDVTLKTNSSMVAEESVESH